jgi:hypothetical protein
MKSLESIVAIEKNGQDMFAQAQLDARAIVAQAEKTCLQLHADWQLAEKKLELELQVTLEKKKQTLAKKAELKDQEKLEALQVLVKKNNRVAQNVLIAQLR